MNIIKTQAFRVAIRKVRKYCKDNKLISNDVKQKEMLIKFFTANKIEFKQEKEALKELLYYLQKSNHVALQIKVPRIKKVTKQIVKNYDGFYETEQWQTLRKQVLKMYGLKCMRCNAKNTELHVDHIKPRSKYKELELSIDNMQVLCKKCNLDKSNKHEIDYRKM
jgi:5-methylcytosine-specific restriction endonuclease McrA